MAEKKKAPKVTLSISFSYAQGKPPFKIAECASEEAALSEIDACIKRGNVQIRRADGALQVVPTGQVKSFLIEKEKE